ncbi:hypothetical protein GPECTOR_25g311 [Gonium pectorale]|uniref:Uncharacterized protein n=1 Tax=Gonium pectorale TaxID=33097 RepID=A0A150GFV0_GONPE|nr:hypothetical protein GPECTOR_25g311 [Gonium pectorale]|eukprot:KXZ48727.1 hypothetical protein GPECTOR_25g311 [Gonium pectorale]
MAPSDVWPGGAAAALTQLSGEDSKGNSRGLIGLFARSQRCRSSASSAHGADSESDDGDPNRFHYPGMPKEPKPVRLRDPYPGGRAEGAPGAGLDRPVEPLEHDGSTTIVFVKAGSEHRALLYLMQKVNRLFGLDDLLPEVSPEIAAYHYLLLKAPENDTLIDGDAATDLKVSTVSQLSGMVVRRIKVVARDPLLAGFMDSTAVQRRWVLGAGVVGELPVCVG